MEIGNEKETPFFMLLYPLDVGTNPLPLDIHLPWTYPPPGILTPHSGHKLFYMAHG